MRNNERQTIMFKFIKNHIIQKRIKAIQESAFPAPDSNIHKWISAFFDVKKAHNCFGELLSNAFELSPKLYGNPHIRHGEIIHKYVSSELLSDNSHYYRSHLTMYWKEFKHFMTDTYTSIQKHMRVLGIWDKLLDDITNQEILEAGIAIVTSSWSEDDAWMCLNPYEADRMLDIVEKNISKEEDENGELERELFRRYKDYVLEQFAKNCDLSTLSAKEPMVKIYTYSTQSIKLLDQISNEKLTASLKIINEIKEKKANLIQECKA